MKKQEPNKKSIYRECLCERPTCAKCLSINCEQENCLIHTKQAKKNFRYNWLYRNQGVSYNIQPNEFGYHEEYKG